MDSYYQVKTSTTGESTLTFWLSLDAPYELSREYDLFAGVAIGEKNHNGAELFFCGFNNTPAET